jgi:Lipocalin-like domain
MSAEPKVRFVRDGALATVTLDSPSTTADDLRTNLIGAWTLQSCEAHSIDGSNVTYPLGVDVQGIIMYSPDGYMSGQLMRSDRARFSGDDTHLAPEDDLAAAASGYLNYAGPKN